ncbi:MULTISPECIES: hypothetical protein [Caballeronia]|uniref:hypothetical protein n=1 Tax=Caballeronia TaxID=1827195 RepID=UPI0035306C79
MAPVLHRSAKDHGHGRPRREVQQQVRALLHQEVSRASDRFGRSAKRAALAALFCRRSLFVVRAPPLLHLVSVVAPGYGEHR